MPIKFENVGIAVRDLEETIAFFSDLGLSVRGRDTVNGEWADIAVGLDGNHAKVAVLQTSDGTPCLELFEYIHPTAIDTEPTRPNEIGMHRVAFSVDDLDAALEVAARHGCQPVLASRRTATSTSSPTSTGSAASCSCSPRTSPRAEWSTGRIGGHSADSGVEVEVGDLIDDLGAPVRVDLQRAMTAPTGAPQVETAVRTTRTSTLPVPPLATAVRAATCRAARRIGLH
jgi:glyoxylase I family protein